MVQTQTDTINENGHYRDNNRNYLEAQNQAGSTATDNDSDNEELADTLEQDTFGYDGLAFLFNDSNEDTIMEKIDENTLEKESKLPLARDNKVNSNALNLVFACIQYI